jgi:transcriptional regulator with XRE-family HTH domain
MDKSPGPEKNQPFGEYFKALRRRLGPMTLREFCSINKLHHSNLSKVERGQLPPPAAPEKLALLARAVGLEPETPAWQEFFDRAYAARGEIPRDLVAEAEVALPSLFRALRGDSISEQDLELLMALIRKA